MKDIPVNDLLGKWACLMESVLTHSGYLLLNDTAYTESATSSSAQETIALDIDMEGSESSFAS